MTNKASIKIQDFSRENSTVNFNPGPLTSANFDAKRAALDTLKTAIDGITLGEVRTTTFSIRTTESVVTVTSPLAQREAKWLVTYRDNTEFLDVANTIENTGFGNLYSVEIPTPDLSLLAAPGDEEVGLAVPAVAAFVTAFEAFQNSPTGGNEIEVISIKNVGRDL